MRTALYCLFSADEALLYVGITNDPERRWEDHWKHKFWWHLVARKDITWHPTREEAAAQEKEIIVAQKPLYNRTWNSAKTPHRAGDPPLPDPFVPALVERLRAGMQSGQYPPGYVFADDHETNRALGTSSITLMGAMVRLGREGLVSDGRMVVKNRKRFQTYVVTQP
ncbi:GIY-YIG nuclease family protein [Streptomyces albidoflavus]|uniref:GIY-YIG nuclease family protein n=1 Tax=Streptomyces albidoflavus TaxID=1886 RepID=UPI00340FA00B